MTDNIANEISIIVKNRLYLTNIVGARNVNKILDLQIDIIVSVLDFNPFEYSTPLSFKHIKLLHFYAVDNEDFKIYDHFENFQKLFDNNPNKKILVHCVAGASRSATLVASFMIKYFVDTCDESTINYYDVNKIIKILQKKRSVVYPNDGFLQQLEDYRNTLIKNKYKR